MVALWSAVCEGDASYLTSCFSHHPPARRPAFVAILAGKVWSSHPLRKVGPCPVAVNLTISRGDRGCPLSEPQSVAVHAGGPVDGAWLWDEVGVTEGIRLGLSLVAFPARQWLPLREIDKVLQKQGHVESGGSQERFLLEMGSLLEWGPEDKQGDLGGQRWGREFLAEEMA